MSQARSFYKNGKTYYLCSGKDNACDAIVRAKGGICGNCAGNVRIRSGQYQVGEIFTIGNTRYRMRENGREILCAKDGCTTRACAGTMCKMHAATAYNGSKGAVMLPNGKQLRTNGLTYRFATDGQWRHTCAHGDCITLIKGNDNYCRKHVPADNAPTDFSDEDHANACDDTTSANDTDQEVAGNTARDAAFCDTDQEVAGNTARDAAFCDTDQEVDGNAASDAVFCDQTTVPTSSVDADTPVEDDIDVSTDIPIDAIMDPNASAAGEVMQVSAKNKRAQKGAVDVHDNQEYYNAAVIDPSREFRATAVQYPSWARMMTYADQDGVKRVVGEIFTNINGCRRMVCVSRKNSSKTLALLPICDGQEGTCKSDAKTGGKCKACAKGNDSVGAHRRELASNTEGNIIICSDGIRYRMNGGQNRQLCQGDNNTCANVRSKGVYCHAHLNNGIPRLKGAKKGDQYIRDGYRAVHNGVQFVKMCDYGIDECKIAAVVDGKCKKHSPKWRCQYTDCAKIRVNCTQYCKIHENGVVNKREMWKLEVAIMNWCSAKGIRYITQYSVTADLSNILQTAPPSVLSQKSYRFDFYIPDRNIFIEADGAQHFRSCHWGGDEGLVHRQHIDDIKSRYAIAQKAQIIRIHAKDAATIDSYLSRVFDMIAGNNIPLMYLSGSYMQEKRYTDEVDIEYIIVRSAVSDKYQLTEGQIDEPIDE